MKRFFTSLLVLAMMLAGITTTRAQLKVAGINVPTTGTTTQTITGSGISGKVTYDPVNKRLVLEDATITATGTNDGIYNMSVDGLFIYCTGTVKISTSATGNNVAGIYCKAKTTICTYNTTDHIATATVSNTGSGPAIMSADGAELNIYRVKLTATASKYHAIYAGKSAEMRVLASYLTAKSEDSNCKAITGFTQGLSINFAGCPLDVFDDTTHSFDATTGCVVKNGTPVQSTTLVPSIMIGDQPLSYTTPVITTVTTGASTVSGSVSFAPNANPWLELDGFSMINRSIRCRIPNLEVRIKGTNTIINAASGGVGIYVYANTLFTGDGSLKVTTTGSNSAAFSTYHGANVTFNINELEARGADHGFYGEQAGTLTLNKYSSNSVYKFMGGNCNLYTGKLVMDGMDIWTPNSYFNSKVYKMYYNGAIATTSNGPSDGTWFKSTNQFTYYPLYVAGTHVNDRNYSNISSQYITGGKVTYDSGTKKLTLNGVQFEATGTDAPEGIVAQFGLDGLTLNFTGEDQHWTTDKEVFDLSSTTTISGSCPRVYLTSNKESGITTRYAASVTINTTGYLGSKGAKYGYYGNGATNEVLTLSKTTEDTFGYTFEGEEGAFSSVTKLQLNNMDFAYVSNDYQAGCYFDEANKRVSQNGGEMAKGRVTLMSIKEKLPIYVAGKQLNVTRSDLSIYVGSPYITSGPKSVKYVPSTKTLTLDNATTVDHGNTGSVLTCGMAVLDEGVTIDVVGTNNITAGNYGIYATKDLTVSGSGNLNVVSTEKGALGINDSGNERTLTLALSGGVHTFQGKTYGFLGWNTGSLAINKKGNGALYKFAGETANIGTTKSLNLGDGVKIHSRYTYFDEEKKAVYNRGEIAKTSDIAQGTWIRGDIEWIEYPLYVCDQQLYGAYVDGDFKGLASGFNCKQYTGTGISYDPESQTLYLNGVTIENEDVYNAIHNQGVSDLKINISGDNNIKVTDNIFRLSANTSFTGTGTVKGETFAGDGYGIWLQGTENPSLVLDGPTFEFNAQRAIGGQQFNTLTFITGALTFEPNVNPRAAIGGLASVNFGEGMAIVEPQGAYYSESLKAVTMDGNNAYTGRVVIDGSATPYALKIADVRVNSANCTDILHNGVFAYDPETNTLTISGDYTYNDWIVYSSIDDLTISVDGNSTLTQQGATTAIRLFANTTITGGKLTLVSEDSDKKSLGIYNSVGTLTIKDADIEINGDGFEYGITGSGTNSVVIDNSDVSVSAHSCGCISDWGYGVTLTNCYIETPETSNIKADGIYNGAGDYFIGGGDATETLVIKAGELTGINELGVRSEELGVGNGQSTYDLNGRKVTTPEKGKIYIINGKKVKK